MNFRNYEHNTPLYITGLVTYMSGFILWNLDQHFCGNIQYVSIPMLTIFSNDINFMMPNFRHIYILSSYCTSLLWFLRNLSVLSYSDWSGRNTWACLLPSSSFMPGGTYWPEREPTCLSYSGNIKWQVPIQDTRYEIFYLSIMDPKRHRDNTENYNLNIIIQIT